MYTPSQLLKVTKKGWKFLTIKLLLGTRLEGCVSSLAVKMMSSGVLFQERKWRLQIIVTLSIATSNKGEGNTRNMIEQ